MAEFKLPSWSARNPLGIVALFISLIYGMSALLLGTSVKSLSSENQTILVVFIVAFPLVVLSVFAWLVVCHHTKLYGPGDYRSDRGFLDARVIAAGDSVGRRLQAELAEADLEADVAGPIQNADKSNQAKYPAPENQGRWKRGFGKSSVLTRAYAAEGLLFQSLQTEFGGAVRRQVRFANGIEVDGIIERPNGESIVVEIKFIAPDSTTFGKRIRHAYAELITTQNALWDQFAQSVKFLLAIIVDGSSEHIEIVKREAESQKDRIGAKVELRVYELNTLLRDHGFPVEPPVQ